MKQEIKEKKIICSKIFNLFHFKMCDNLQPLKYTFASSVDKIILKIMGTSTIKKKSPYKSQITVNNRFENCLKIR